MVAFRKDILGGKLVPYEKVEGGIKDQAISDGPPTTWLEIPVIPVGDRASSLHEALQYRPMTLGDITSADAPFYRDALGLPNEFQWQAESALISGRMPTLSHLEYSVPNHAWIRVQPVARAGVLEGLVQVSRELRKSFPWKTAQATLFVLTGLCPEVKRVELGVRGEGASTRIYLFVDPSVPPTEVAERYQHVRDGLLSRRTGASQRRMRGMSDKHLRLAAFVAECHESQSWQERMTAWNQAHPSAEYPGYAYTDRRLFWRDAVQAQNRLLQPDYWAQTDFFDYVLPEGTWENVPTDEPP